LESNPYPIPIPNHSMSISNSNSKPMVIKSIYNIFQTIPRPIAIPIQIHCQPFQIYSKPNSET
jgi:hypothetical protein